MMQVIAVRGFAHGRRIAAGEKMSVSDKIGHALLERGLVRLPYVKACAPVPVVASSHATEYVCIASGPSLTASDCDAARAWRARGGRRVIVVNTSWRLAPWADMLYACDRQWWDQSIDEVRAGGFCGELWTQDAGAAKEYGLHHVVGKPAPGLGRDGVIHHGNNSGYQAVNLAYLFGARRIVLLGYDMQPTGGMSHWHGDHPWKPAGQKPPTAGWVKRFSALASDLAGEGVEVVNATRETALKCFPQMRLEEALCA